MENRFNNTFLEIINLKYEEKYIEYLNKLENKNLSKRLIAILQEKELSKRLEMWKDFSIKLNEIKDVKYLSNPFYIGYGNPNAEILFLGKEKAIDVAGSPEIFFHESINNILQWEQLSIGNDQDLKLEFNPLCPQSYHKEKNEHKIKKRDTWGMYAQITKGVSNNEEITHDNFFDYCFTTEVNYIPSKYSAHLKLHSERMELLQKQFYKNFKYVIVGAIGSITESEIKEIFGENLESKMIEIGENKRGKIKITVLKNDNQKIILCNQLSGASGWTKGAIQELIREIKTN